MAGKHTSSHPLLFRHKFFLLQCNSYAILPLTGVIRYAVPLQCRTINVACSVALGSGLGDCDSDSTTTSNTNFDSDSVSESECD